MNIINNVLDFHHTCNTEWTHEKLGSKNSVKFSAGTPIQTIIDGIESKMNTLCPKKSTHYKKHIKGFTRVHENKTSKLLGWTVSYQIPGTVSFVSKLTKLMSKAQLQVINPKKYRNRNLAMQWRHNNVLISNIKIDVDSNYTNQQIADSLKEQVYKDCSIGNFGTNWVIPGYEDITEITEELSNSALDKKTSRLDDPYVDGQLKSLRKELDSVITQFNSLGQVKKALTINGKDIGNLLRKKRKTSKGWSVEVR